MKKDLLKLIGLFIGMSLIGIMAKMNLQKYVYVIPISLGIYFIFKIVSDFIRKKVISLIFLDITLALLAGSALLILYLNEYSKSNLSVGVILSFFMFFIILPVIGTYHAYKIEDWERFRGLKIALPFFIIGFIVMTTIILLAKRPI